MNETKFTLGPWINKNGILVTASDGRGVICVFKADSVNFAAKYLDTESKANANLIAAAPELYEALEMALACELMSAKQMPEPDWFGTARAALAKARGEVEK